MAAAGAVMAVGGMMGNIITATEQNKLQNQSSEFNAKMDLYNAQNALAESAEDERRFRIQTKQALGDIRAGYGASGVTLEGSPMEILRQSASNAELDALTIRHKGAIKAWAYENQVKLDQFEGYASDVLLPSQIMSGVGATGSSVASSYALRRT